MSAPHILDGKATAQQFQAQLTQRVTILTNQWGRPPGLAVLLVGDHPASQVYVRNKEQACERVGIASLGRHFPTTATQSELLEAIKELNQDNRVDGILLQLPLPSHLDAITLLHHIDPNKDVDGLHPLNLGRLVRGEPGLRSCTPAGVMYLLNHYQIPIAKSQAVVVGRSILVGKPMAFMLLNANATVTLAHSHTPDLAAVVRSADIVVAAVGVPRLINASMVKPGAVVVDVGMNRIPDPNRGYQLVGDVDFPEVEEVASFITPVPGGVGPMTVSLLLSNTVWSYEQRMGERVDLLI